jgi:large subunit ribosomal protein L29
MKAKNLREKTSVELLKDKNKLHKELSDLRFKKVLSVLENPLKIRLIKRDIAKINTIIYEREIEKIRSGN